MNQWHIQTKMIHNITKEMEINLIKKEIKLVMLEKKAFENNVKKRESPIKFNCCYGNYWRRGIRNGIPSSLKYLKKFFKTL
jgi:hypothetical protein